LPVTDQARVGCPSTAIFGHETVYDMPLEVGLEVEDVKRHAQHLAEQTRILHGLRRTAAVRGSALFRPQAHHTSSDVVPLLLK